MERTLAPLQWLQANVEFADPAEAERVAARYLGPVFLAAEADRAINSWFFVRKSPTWRLRYSSTDDMAAARAQIVGQLHDLGAAKIVRGTVEVVYEPETRAFGGAQAMALAHRLWHIDSRQVLAYLGSSQEVGRRELSVVLYSAFMRAASLDWYEQGDVWARVAEHRDPPSRPAGFKDLENRVRRLMTAGTGPLFGPDAVLSKNLGWCDAFVAAGGELARLAADGRLLRGLRDVLAHHVVFAWNRLGLSANAQAMLASTAANVVFGTKPDRRRASSSIACGILGAS
jgi:thiopeptide-type bacteriocin biosynthesis protein